MVAAKLVDFSKSFDAMCIIQKKKKKRAKGNKYDEGMDDLWTRGQLMMVNNKYSSSIVVVQYQQHPK